MLPLQPLCEMIFEDDVSLKLINVGLFMTLGSPFVMILMNSSTRRLWIQLFREDLLS